MAGLWLQMPELHGRRVMRVDAVGRCLVTGGVGIYGVAEFLRRFEEWDAFGWDIDFVAGLGVASDAGVALAGTKAAKATNFNFVTGFESAYDRVE